MAQLPQPANTDTNSEGLGNRSLLQPGDYVVVITKSEFKETKAKNGYYLNLTLVVAEGPRKGSMLWTLLNLDNPNPIAVEIANKELNSICQACGLVAVEDSEELHNIPFGVTVAIKPATSEFAASNVIKNYMPADEVEVDGELPQDNPTAPQSNPTGASEQTKKAPKETKQKLPWEE